MRTIWIIGVFILCAGMAAAQPLSGSADAVILDAPAGGMTAGFGGSAMSFLGGFLNGINDMLDDFGIDIKIPSPNPPNITPSNKTPTPPGPTPPNNTPTPPSPNPPTPPEPDGEGVSGVNGQGAWQYSSQCAGGSVSSPQVVQNSISGGSGEINIDGVMELPQSPEYDVSASDAHSGQTLTVTVRLIDQGGGGLCPERGEYSYTGSAPAGNWNVNFEVIHNGNQVYTDSGSVTVS